ISKDAKNPIVYLIPEKTWHKVAAISFMSIFEATIKAALMCLFMIFTELGVGLSIALSLLFLCALSSAVYIDMFFSSVFGRFEIGIFQSLLSAGLKLFVTVMYGGIYAAICLLSSVSPGRYAFGFVSILGLFVVFVITVGFNAGALFLSDGLIEEK
ncbi:MAG: hypothetical protein LBU94_04840, partial [Clostridiales bacterium]|nr:hypothetical protein [Clostridiales bacterium]